MPTALDLVLLYVDDPLKSAVFYEKLLGSAPVGKFPTYVSFAFSNGLQLGLWSTQARNFVSGGSGHRSEIAFMVSDEQQVQQMYESWQKHDVVIEQPLHKAVFGLTFVATDPDGHRIRVCLPDPPA
jgi:catechol 2,3-dioxygenase-like lactoylglutathione lyase family enzyme